MASLIETTKTQDRGVITIPQSVRERLGIKKGSTIAFVENDEGRVEIRVVEDAFIAAIDEIGDALKERGMTMAQWLAAGSKNRKKLFKQLYPELSLK